MEKGRIGKIEEKIFNTQVLGNLETGIGNDGTSIPELLGNIRNELREYLNWDFMVKKI
jgi:hypothetical protein